MPVELVPQRLQPLRSLENRGGRDYERHRFHFISYAQLVKDCTALARSLPPTRAVVGVPRSGMIPASAVALELNVPMLSIETLFQAEEPQILVPRRGFGTRVKEGMILVVDDTSASGRQIDHLRTLVRVPLPVRYAAIYVEDRPVICVDYYHSKLPDVAQFYEWTMFHDHHNGTLLTDLDGVLCEDWMGGNEQQNEAAYLDFLKNARPRRIPSIPLKGIVTNRLERHRPETDAWLSRHGIRYSTLHMSPHSTFAARNVARKATLYAADASLCLFIESDDHQAQEIARRTGRPVFSIAPKWTGVKTGRTQSPRRSWESALLTVVNRRKPEVTPSPGGQGYPRLFLGDRQTPHPKCALIDCVRSAEVSFCVLAIY